MRRAQMIGQVFIFIMAALVFVLILTYGYHAITQFLARGEEVQLLDFRNELDSTITTIKRDYGSVQKVVLRVPPKTDEVCFVSAELKDSAVLEQQYPLLYSAWATGSENVFLIPRQPTPIRVADVLVDTPEGFACIAAVNGRVALRVEGTGNKAKVSEWPS